MSSLSELYARLNALNTEKAHTESEIRKYKQRRNDVVKVKQNLGNVGDNNFSTVNSWANKIIDNFSNSLKGTTSVGKIVGKVTDDLEKDSECDSKIFSGKSEFSREITRIDGVISNLESDLARINANIRSTQDAIAAEQRRLAEEAARAEAAQRAAQQSR